MEQCENILNKVDMLRRWGQVALLAIAIGCFLLILAVVAETVSRLAYMGDLKSIALLVFVTVLVTGVAFKLAEQISKLMPSTAGRSLFSFKATKCGHMTARKGKVSAFGITITTRMPKNDQGSVDYCLDCIGTMAIQCAWCGKPIFIGDPITLYTPNEGYEIPLHAVVYRRAPLQLVGCLRMDCADTGGDRAGFWIPGENGKGWVRRVPTAEEYLLGVSPEAPGVT